MQICNVIADTDKKKCIVSDFYNHVYNSLRSLLIVGWFEHFEEDLFILFATTFAVP